jgi:hypothetical protein
MDRVQTNHTKTGGGRFSKITQVSIFLVFAISGNVWAQTPVTYSFTTGNAPFGGPAAPIFAGQSVSGTFVYDRDSLATGTLGVGASAGSTLYGGSVTDLVGFIDGNSFSDPIGVLVVGDEKFMPFGGSDILVYAADPELGAAPPEFFNFSGFDIAGLTLTNARLFWIEGLPGVGDFLSDQSLPTVLPDIPGRFALDFVPTGTLGPVTSVFFDLATVSPLIETVTIDIKPGNTPNSINPGSNQKIPVAVLTTETFDATQIDPLTVVFGPGEASESHGRSHIEDVDKDGDADLVLHFRVQESGIQCSDTEATLSGETFDGRPITGSDAIRTVPCPEPDGVTYDFTQTFGNIAVSGTLTFIGDAPGVITVDELNALATWDLSFSAIVPDPVFPLEPFTLSSSDSSWTTELLAGTSLQVDATTTELSFDLTTPLETNAAVVLVSDDPDFRQFRFGQGNQPGFVGSFILIQGNDFASDFSPLPFDDALTFPATGP